MAGKQYEVVRPFRRTDPRTGNDTNWEPEQDYTGPVDKPYYLDPRGPDGRGALLREKPSPNAEKSVSPTTNDSSSKEK